jgi:hypothetical protein
MRNARVRAVAALRRAATVVVRAVRAGARALPQRGRATPELVVSDYKAPNYWLDYRRGFVRRGLPGELLRRIVGGPPTKRQVEAMAVGLSRAAALSVVPMAVRATRHAPRGLPRAAATALLVLSPLSCSLLLHDTGRYDTVGVLALGLLAGVGSARGWLPAPVGTALAAAAVCVATASEEFLLALVAPAAAVAVSGPGSRARRLLRCGVVLAPGTAVAAASLLVPAPSAALHTAREQATRAGVGAPGAMGDTLSAVDRSLVQNLAFFRLFEPAAVAVALALWTGFYVATTAVLGRLLGGGATYRTWVAVHAAPAAALCAVGTDFRRWWGLGFLGLVATLAAQEPTDRPEPGRGTVAGAALLTLAGWAVRDVRVYPGGPLRLDGSLPAVRWGSEDRASLSGG